VPTLRSWRSRSEISPSAGASDNDLDAELDPPHRSPRLDLAQRNIRTIIWATGYRPDHSWLEVPVLDRKGRIRHDGGIVDAPGMYLTGMPFLRRRKSALIDGAADDARDLSDHLASHLAGSRAPVHLGRVRAMASAARSFDRPAGRQPNAS
jgi:putative flavoprotein involved in K+ transport